MDSTAIISQLQHQYPGKTIIQNDDNQPTEILCEIEPSSNHPDYSIAIAVIDRSLPHYHQHTQETYEVIQGTLTLYTSPHSNLRHPELDSGSRLDFQSITLTQGDTHTIKPGTYHYATGNETWVKVTSHPGWTITDHIQIKA